MTENLPLETIKELELSAEKALRNLRERRESLENEAREQRLAHIKPLVIRAHSLLCSWNHCDGCSWGYEMTGDVHNWNGWAHARWLRHYEDLLLNRTSKPAFPCTVEQLSVMLDTVEALRSVNPNALWLIRNGVCAP